MNVKDLCQKLTDTCRPEAEVLIYDPDGEGLFPVTSFIFGGLEHGLHVVELMSDNDYLPDDSPWKEPDEI